MTRPLRHRRGARVVLLAGDAVLLIGDSDPGVPDSGWWVTPGGGIDDGETPRAAAAREAHEETGLGVDAADLRGPAAERVAVHGYSDRVLVQHETFYLLDVDRFEPEGLAWTQSERHRLRGFRWWPVAGLPDNVWPASLARLAQWQDGEPLELGVMDESSVPLTPEDRERVADYLRGAGLRLNP